MARSFPANLEQAVLLAGPQVFAALVRDAGGLSAAARLAGSTRGTLSRWITSRPFARSFGAGVRDARHYQSVWFGYPPPLPGLDRVTEAILGADVSFVGALSLRLENPVRELALSDSFGLEWIFSSAQITEGLAEAGIPPSTARRWRRHLTYPSQLQVLDRLSLEMCERRWLHLVLEATQRDLVEPTPPAALRALILHLKCSSTLDAGAPTG